MTVNLDKMPRTLPLVARPWQRTPEYKDYITAQVAKTQRMSLMVIGQRVTDLIGLLVRCDDRSPKGRSVLCVGCRNLHELRVCHAAGFGPVVGIDLLASEATIQAMDMHAMAFPDQVFDVVFSCHSLEHAYDAHVVLKEWHRVTAPDGTWVIEVPVGYETTAVDRVDFTNLDGLKAACAPYLERVLFSDERRGVARLIGVVK